jgi:hypothetical protein
MARKIVLKNTGLSASGYTPVGYESVGYQNGILSQKDFTENVIPVGATGATGGVGPIGATGATGGYGPVGPTGPAGGVDSTGTNGYYAIFTGTSSIGNGSIYDDGTATVITGTVSLANTIMYNPSNADTTLLSSTTQGYLIGYGNNVDLVSATMGAYLQFYGSDYLPSQGLQLNVIGGSSMLLYDNLFQIQALSPTNSNNLNIIMDEKSLVIDQYAGSLFPGIQYSGATTLANVLANQDGTSLLHRDANDLRYLMIGSGITGSGTIGYIPKFIGTRLLENSLIFDDGNNIGINNIIPAAKLHILGSTTSSSEYSLIIQDSLSTNLLVIRDDGYGAFGSDVNGNYNFTITGNGGTLGTLLVTDQHSRMEILSTSSDAELQLNSATGHQAFIQLSNNSVDALYLSTVGGAYNYFQNFQPLYFRNGSNQTHTFFDSTNGMWAFQAPSSSIFSPSAIVHIQGSTTSNTSYSLIIQDGLSNEIITVRDDSYTTINGSLYVATNPTAFPYNDYFFFNAGNLSINTLGYIYDPSERLSINGNMSVTQGADILFGNTNTSIFSAASGAWPENTGDTNSLVLNNSQGSIFYYVNGNSNDAAHIFQSVQNGQGSTVERFRINNNGTVGIGTSSNTSMFTIQNNSNGNIVNIVNSIGGNVFNIDDSGDVSIGDTTAYGGTSIYYQKNSGYNGITYINPNAGNGISGADLVLNVRNTSWGINTGGFGITDEFVRLNVSDGTSYFQLNRQEYNTYLPDTTLMVAFKEGSGSYTDLENAKFVYTRNLDFNDVNDRTFRGLHIDTSLGSWTNTGSGVSTNIGLHVKVGNSDVNTAIFAEGGDIIFTNLAGVGNRALEVDSAGKLIVGSGVTGSVVNKFSTASYSLTASVTDTITHGLGSTFIQISVWDSVVGDLVSVSANNRTLNTVDITSSVTGTYDIIITG